MSGTESERTPLLTPTHVVAGLALLVLAIALAVFVRWRVLSSLMTIEIDQPVGATVVSHFVVDGRPESRTDTVPVTYEFQASHLTYAIIGEDPSTGSIRVRFQHSQGAAGSATGDGVKGECQGGGFTTVMSMGGMSSHDAGIMRAAVLAQRAPAIAESASAPAAEEATP